MNHARILVVEDERPMRTALEDCLETEGYRVFSASDGADGLQRALQEKPDLILLDVMMPDLDGFELCRELRRVGESAPILMITAKGQVQDRVTGLDAGADDYLVKPFSSEELLARIRALLRRFSKASGKNLQLRLGKVEIDLGRQICTRNGKELYLSTREYAMLRLLAEADGGAVSRERFLDAVWGYGAFPTTRTVDTHMANLRAKIELKPESPADLKTVHGTGYRLELGRDLTEP